MDERILLTTGVAFLGRNEAREREQLLLASDSFRRLFLGRPLPNKLGIYLHELRKDQYPAFTELAWRRQD